MKLYYNAFSNLDLEKIHVHPGKQMNLYKYHSLCQTGREQVVPMFCSCPCSALALHILKEENFI